MGNYATIKYNEIVKTGTITSWGNSTVPSGYLECDGSAVSRTTYADLFAVISTDYGAGDGSTTFNLPDLQDNVAVGASGTKAVASTGGSATQTPAGTITVNNHTLTTSQLASHSHQTSVQGTDQVSGVFESRFPCGGGGVRGTVTLGTNSQGSNSAHNHGGSFAGSSLSTLQPYVAMKFMIKT